MTKPFLILLVVIGAMGCKSVQVVNSSDRPIVLKETQRRVSIKGSNTIDFPPGIYQADFKTKDGIYYRAPSRLGCKSLGVQGVMRGGLYLPFPSDPDQRQGAWFDQQGSSGGLGGMVGMAATAITRVFRFKEPLPYERQVEGAQ